MALRLLSLLLLLGLVFTGAEADKDPAPIAAVFEAVPVPGVSSLTDSISPLLNRRGIPALSHEEVCELALLEFGALDPGAGYPLDKVIALIARRQPTVKTLLVLRKVSTDCSSFRELSKSEPPIVTIIVECKITYSLEFVEVPSGKVISKTDSTVNAPRQTMPAPPDKATETATVNTMKVIAELNALKLASQEILRSAIALHKIPTEFRATKVENDKISAVIVRGCCPAQGEGCDVFRATPGAVEEPKVVGSAIFLRESEDNVELKLIEGEAKSGDIIRPREKAAQDK